MSDRRKREFLHTDLVTSHRSAVLARLQELWGLATITVTVQRLIDWAEQELLELLPVTEPEAPAASAPDQTESERSGLVLQAGFAPPRFGPRRPR